MSGVEPIGSARVCWNVTSRPSFVGRLRDQDASKGLALLGTGPTSFEGSALVAVEHHLLFIEQDDQFLTERQHAAR